MKAMLAIFLSLMALHRNNFAGDSPAQNASAGSSGTAKIIHRADVIPARAAGGKRGGLWPLYSTEGVRMNYFEVAGPSSMHLHPDAEHRLYVLEGKLEVTAGTNVTVAIPGDLVIIPKGVPHRYNVQAPGEHALLLTFDAPPYDPAKTIAVEKPSTGLIGRK